MRLLFVTNLFPPDIGGPATYVPKIAAEFVARGHDVSVVAGAPPELIPATTPPSPYPVWRVSRRLPLPLRLGVALLTLLKAVRGADVLYVQGLAGPEMVAVLVARLLGKPVALKIVGDNAWEYAIRKGLTDDGIDEFQHEPYGPKLRFIRALVHGYARLVTRLIVPSEYLRGVVRGWGVSAERAMVIRNALTAPLATDAEREQARRELREKHGLQGAMVVTSARLYPWKNLDFLVRLVSDWPEGVSLFIVGGGPDHDELQRLVDSLGISDCVTITGNISHAEVQRYLRAADVFVLNTRYEGLSHVLLEAMAAGAPVIASAVGGNPEVIRDGETGLLVPLNDGQAITAAVMRLLATPAEVEHLTSAAREAVQDFSWPTLVEHTERALLEAAGPKAALAHAHAG